MLDKTARIIRLHPDDNVVIALGDLAEGVMPEGLDAALRQPAPQGHKIASRDIRRGENVVRYGQIIGQATADIPAGAHVHSHNLGMGEHERDYAFGTDLNPPATPNAAREWMGYHRSDGKVGTRNYLGVLTSVNCSGSVARFIAEQAERLGLVRRR